MNAQRDDAVSAFCNFAVGLKDEDVPAQTRANVHKFVLDSFGVGIAGSCGPHVEALISTFCANSGIGTTRIWGDRRTLSTAAAATCLAYQIHNSEFDCVHEEAVVHPMAVVLGAMVSICDRLQAEGKPVHGRSFTTAVCAAVDVAAGLGISSRSPLKFFRPGTAGLFGAVAGSARLLGLDARQMRNAMGIALAQAGGTMQAHIEGSPVLAMQVGFNARNAVMAVDLAAHDVPGPQHSFEGPFGYLTLFEGDFDTQQRCESFCSRFLIDEVAHKPFPSGRATHGIVDACLAMKAESGFDVADVQAVAAKVPPLTHRLVGRPSHDAMGVNYARLSGPFVAASALHFDSVGIEHFAEDALRNQSVLELATRIEVVADDNPDPNALTPIVVQIALNDGRVLEKTLDVIYGHPDNPMSREAYLQKFRRNWSASREALAEGDCERCIELLEGLDDTSDVSEITRLMHAAAREA